MGRLERYHPVTLTVTVKYYPKIRGVSDKNVKLTIADHLIQI
jgi:hypothetical protein